MSIADVLSNRAPWHVECADAVAAAKMLPDDCISTICTSPPYFALRSYLEKDDPNKHLEIGLDDTPDAYAARLVELFRELRRALHPSGTLWLNLGDSYAQTTCRNRNGFGNIASACKLAVHRIENDRSTVGGDIKPKDLIGVPWLVAFALRADGWFLRQYMPWVVRNKMPESADDRPSTACETVFLLSKCADYHFDMEAVKRQPSLGPADTRTHDGVRGAFPKSQIPGQSPQNSRCGVYESRNFRSADLWFDSVGMLLAGHLDGSDDGTILGLDVSTQSYRGSHFAVWPQRLVANFIAAGSSERGVCPHCSAPHVRVVKKQRVATRPGCDSKVGVIRKSVIAAGGTNATSILTGNRDPERHVTRTETVGWEPSCECPPHDPLPSIIYDPFTGSGTTGKVALDMNRRFLGSELNADYMKLISARMRSAKPSLF